MKFAVLLLLAAVSTATVAETPSNLLGHYRSAPKKVCQPGGNGHRAVCSRLSDALRIEASGFEGRRDVKVTAEFNLPDAQICSFAGTGYWIPESRRLVVADARTGCEMSLVAETRVLRGIVVRPDQCNSPCAGRTWLEGVVLRRR